MTSAPSVRATPEVRAKDGRHSELVGCKHGVIQIKHVNRALSEPSVLTEATRRPFHPPNSFTKAEDVRGIDPFYREAK